MNLVVTGAKGFIGRHAVEAASRQDGWSVVAIDSSRRCEEFAEAVRNADVIVHLAGVNRPEREEQFQTGNVDLTGSVVRGAAEGGKKPLIVFSSSTQAEADNPYGRSKKQAECLLLEAAEQGVCKAAIFRLPNVFGKWCRPNYNSVVATFCHNIANGLPISVSDPSKSVSFVYIDDVVAAILNVAEGGPPSPSEAEVRRKAIRGGAVEHGTEHSAGNERGAGLGAKREALSGSQGAKGADGVLPALRDASRASTLATVELPPDDSAFFSVCPVYDRTLGDLATSIQGFRDMRTNLTLPDFHDRFLVNLYATYLSYLPKDAFGYQLTKREDNRGSLAEFIKSEHAGQIFVSRTHPGITRGNHYHHTKTEKFLVLEGSAVIRFRHIESDEVIEYPVSGEEYKVVDIPPGYTHSIENVGQSELVTLFWASEIFDPNRSDTVFVPVQA